MGLIRMPCAEGVTVRPLWVEPGALRPENRGALDAPAPADPAPPSILFRRCFFLCLPIRKFVRGLLSCFAPTLAPCTPMKGASALPAPSPHGRGRRDGGDPRRTGREEGNTSAA